VYVACSDKGVFDEYVYEVGPRGPACWGQGWRCGDGREGLLWGRISGAVAQSCVRQEQQPTPPPAHRRRHPPRPLPLSRPPRGPQARLEKEAQAVANWERASAGFTSLADFHAWFYSDHLCYAVPKQHLFGVRTIKDDRLLASY
jgi:hypothetical protein